MATQAELQHGATYLGRAMQPEYGKNPKSGRMEIRLSMEIVEGPLTGIRVKWTANMKNAKSIAFAKRDMIAAGWQGQSVLTFVTDVKTATASGRKVPFEARLAVNGQNEDGSPNTWWTAGSIGGGSVPLIATDSDDDRNVDQWFTNAGDIQPREPDDHSTTNNSSSRHPNASGNDDDLPAGW